MAEKKELNNNPFGVPDLSSLGAKLGNMAPPFIMPELRGPFIPDIDYSKLIPVSESMREALGPVYAELTRVTRELTKVNERAELAERRADTAESRTTVVHWIMGSIAVLAIVIPCLQSNFKSQEKDKGLKALPSIVRQQGLQIKTLKAEVSKAKTQQHPAKAPLRSNAKTPN